MPYSIAKRGDKFCVQKQDGSKTFGCHPTEKEAKKQLAAIYANTNEPRAAEEVRNLHLLGATGQVRTEIVNGLEHLVVPVVALVEGVIHPVNAETPEFVSAELLQVIADTWNKKPATLYHPKKNGKQCSAQDADIIANSGIGTLRNARVENKKLLVDALVNKVRTKELHPDLCTALSNGDRVEVSVGAFVLTDKTPGVYNGKPYMASWVAGQGDHLAFLPGGRGACSVEMGCGTHRAAMHFVTAEGFEMRTLEEDLTDLRGCLAFTTLEGESLEERISLVKDAVYKEWNDPPQPIAPWAYVREIFDDHAIVCRDDKMFSVPYTIGEDGLVKLGKATEVKMSYVAATADDKLKTAAGARHSTSDMKTIQAVHDHAMALGAKCDRSNYKTMEEKKPETVSVSSDPNRYYIEMIRKESGSLSVKQAAGCGCGK